MTFRDRWRQFWCGLRGHTDVLHYERSRLMMRCTSCGHDSPGWQTSDRAPIRTYDADLRFRKQWKTVQRQKKRSAQIALVK